MFYLAYLYSELRRRKGRTLLTALGLGVGVGLVVTVSALATGLELAQDKVLEPLTGVGTDMSVTRPLKIDSQGQGPAACPRASATSSSARTGGRASTSTRRPSRGRSSPARTSCRRRS